MMLNCHARKLTLKASFDSDRSKESYDFHEREEKDENKGINPINLLLEVFHCFDRCLRQCRALKLSECQVNAPFLWPDREAPSERVTMQLLSIEDNTKHCKDSSEVFVTEYSFPVAPFIRVDTIIK